MSTSLHNLAYYGTLPLQYGVKTAVKAAYCCNLISKDTFRLLSGKSEAGFLEKTGRFLKRLGNAFVRVFKKEKPQSAWTAGGASLPSLLAGAGAAAYYRNEIAQVLHPIMSNLGITKPAEAAAEVAHHIGNALSSAASPVPPQQAASSLLGTASNLAFNRYTFGATGLAAATAAAYHSGVFGKAGEYISETLKNTAKETGASVMEGVTKSLEKPIVEEAAGNETSGQLNDTVKNMVHETGQNLANGALESLTEAFKHPEETLSGNLSQDAERTVKKISTQMGSDFMDGAINRTKQAAWSAAYDVSSALFHTATCNIFR
jgi:hypothetical protein